MPFFIYNTYNNLQKWGVLDKRPLADVLYEGASLKAFIKETGFTKAKLGGIKRDGDTLVFDEDLLDEFTAKLARIEASQAVHDQIEAEFNALSDTKKSHYQDKVSFALNAIADGVPYKATTPLEQLFFMPKVDVSLARKWFDLIYPL